VALHPAVEGRIGVEPQAAGTASAVTGPAVRVLAGQIGLAQERHFARTGHSLSLDFSIFTSAVAHLLCPSPERRNGRSSIKENSGRHRATPGHSVGHRATPVPCLERRSPLPLLWRPGHTATFKLRRQGLLTAPPFSFRLVDSTLSPSFFFLQPKSDAVQLRTWRAGR
jgi:hypothetical protein